MKRYIKSLISLGLGLTALWIVPGCEEPLTQEEPAVLEISYEDISVIPNQGTVTVTPEISSGTPSGFAIIEVFSGETGYEGKEFSIDSQSGAVSVNIDGNTPVGDYAISITCSSDGRSYILKNILTVSVISGMPEQMTVDPATLNLRYEDLQEGSEAELATASVVTAGASAAITGYELRNLRLRTLTGGETVDTPMENISEYFTISDAGVISAVRGTSWDLATYVMDVKINTESFGPESPEGLLTDALTVNVAATVITVSYPAEPEYIAPNLTKTYPATVDGPQEGGPQVTDFAITGVTLDGAEFSGSVFTIDASTGDITAVAGADLAAGDYAVSISYQYAGQALFAGNVLTVHARPGTPSSLGVSPSSSSIELPTLTEVAAGTVYGTYQVSVSGESAEVTGYEISAVKLGGSPVNYDGMLSIDGVSGEISVLAHSGWQIGTYTVDVKANTESFGSSDTSMGVFENALTINVVAAMIFNYDDAAATHKFATGWTVSPESTLNNAVYSWADASADYTKYLSLNSSTGAVSAVKGNLLPENSYEVKVSAAVSGSEPVSATYSFSVTENPYYFSHFSYGNNLGLSEEETSGVSQFRVTSAAELSALTLEIDYTKGDLKESAGATFSNSRKNQLNGVAVASGTGAVTFTSNSFTAQAMGITFVTATATDPDDADNTWTVTIPVFVDCSGEANGVSVQYSPFAIRVNPSTQTEVRTDAPVIGGSTASNLAYLDFRRTFNYWNIDGVDSDGNEHTSGSLSNANAPNFMSAIWDACYAATTTVAANYGAKYPVSYFFTNGTTPKNDEQKAASPCFVDNENGYSLVIHPNLWTANGGVADGVFCGQMTFSADLSALNGGTQIFPVAIWFDKDYNE